MYDIYGYLFIHSLGECCAAQRNFVFLHSLLLSFLTSFAWCHGDVESDFTVV